MRVQAGRGLVEEDQLRLAHRTHGDCEALALTARDTLEPADRIADDGVGGATEVERGDELLAQRHALRRARAAWKRQVRRHLKGLPDGLRSHDGIVLLHIC